MEETKTVTISNRTWTWHSGSPQGTRTQESVAELTIRPGRAVGRDGRRQDSTGVLARGPRPRSPDTRPNHLAPDDEHPAAPGTGHRGEVSTDGGQRHPGRGNSRCTGLNRRRPARLPRPSPR